GFVLRDPREPGKGTARHADIEVISRTSRVHDDDVAIRKRLANSNFHLFWTHGIGLLAINGGICETPCFLTYRVIYRIAAVSRVTEWFFTKASEEHVRREKARARELRASQCGAMNSVAASVTTAGNASRSPS